GPSHPQNKPMGPHDLFVSFLEAEPMGRAPHDVPVPQGFGGLDWPVHAQPIHHDPSTFIFRLGVRRNMTSCLSPDSCTDDANWPDFLSGAGGVTSTTSPFH